MKTAEALNKLGLKWMSTNYTDILNRSLNNNLSIDDIMLQLCEGELENKHQNKITRLLKQSCIDKNKTLETINWTPYSTKVRHKIEILCDKEFIFNSNNALVFGLPGRGKTHLISGVGIELIKQGIKVLFKTTRELIEELLVAKREQKLNQELKKLDNYDVIICDDFGYVEQTKEEMEVFFSFLSERYERRSVMITSNLVFSEWEKIFKDKMLTLAAIDRLIHHSEIIELGTEESWRVKEASNKKQVDK